MKHTPGLWRWGEDWKAADEGGSVYYSDGEGNLLIEKYMDMQLYGGNGKPIIPIRIDHFEMIYDGDPISLADRKLIAAAPLLLEALEDAYHVLADIVNASDNGEPYNDKELKGFAVDCANRAYKAISAATE